MLRRETNERSFVRRVQQHPQNSSCNYHTQYVLIPHLLKMSIQIETDLKEILDRIEQKIDKLDDKFTQKIDKLDSEFSPKIDKLNDDISELKIGQTEIKGEIKALDEKVKGIDEKVKNQEFLNRATVVGLLLAILGGIAKMFGIVGNR